MKNQYNSILEESIHQQLDETGVVRETAHGEAYSLSERISALDLWRRSLADQSCELRAQVKTLSEQLEAMHRDNERLGQAVTALRAYKTQPEPSRLQIAAMIFAAWEANSEVERLRQRDSERCDFLIILMQLKKLTG